MSWLLEIHGELPGCHMMEKPCPLGQNKPQARISELVLVGLAT